MINFFKNFNLFEEKFNYGKDIFVLFYYENIYFIR